MSKPCNTTLQNIRSDVWKSRVLLADRESKHQQKENLFLGQLPTQLVVGVGDNDAYNCVITKSPFHFKHNNISFITIYRDGVQIPSKSLQQDFASDRFIRSYLRLFTQIGQYYCNTGHTISRGQYKDGCALFAFDLTSQMDSSEVGFELIKHGNMRIEIHFANVTARTLTVIVFAENDNLLKIDQDRNVVLTTRHEHDANRTFAQKRKGL